MCDADALIAPPLEIPLLPPPLVLASDAKRPECSIQCVMKRVTGVRRRGKQCSRLGGI